MLKLTHIYIYPIKSLGGIALTEALSQEQGLQYDRRWMLVDEEGLFMSQRQHPKMALLKTSIADKILKVIAPDESEINIPLNYKSDNIAQVKVWDDECGGYEIGEDYNKWFSSKLETTCRLIFIGDQERFANPLAVKHQEKVSYADGYQYLIAGQSSLDDLNERLDKEVPMNRFRPNLVFSGGNSFEEDFWGDFSIGNVDFYGIKPCARCIMITIDQQTALKGKEPLKTLATFRQREHKIYFGLNAAVKKEGIIKVGDDINVLNGHL